MTTRSRSLRRLITVLGLIAAATVAHPQTAAGSTVIPMNLRELTYFSGCVFVGTVSDMRSEWTLDQTTVVTHVTFVDVVYAKGNREERTLILTSNGGTVGEDTIILTGQPSFRIAQRCIVFSMADLGSAGNSYCPLIGLYQGFFSVHPDRPGGPPVVHDWADRPLAALRDGRAVVVAAPAESEHSSSGSVASFQERESVPADFQPRLDLQSPLAPPFIFPSLTQSSPAKPPATYSAPALQGVIELPRPDSAPVEILPSSDDPGTRMSEASFVAGIRALSLAGR